MRWVMIWAFLLLVAGAYLSARAWGLWGQTKELGSELVIAQRRLDEVERQLEELAESSGPRQLAVLSGAAAARDTWDLARAARRRARWWHRQFPTQ
ncbi:MAG: hypothetical protein ABI934_03030 [Actinomycetota bacterium]